MFLGKVVGTVWASRKIENMNGRRLLEVQVLDIFLEGTGVVKTAVDALGAGFGETVLCASGSAARKWFGTDDLSHEAMIIGIVDRVDIDRQILQEIFPALKI